MGEVIKQIILKKIFQKPLDQFNRDLFRFEKHHNNFTFRIRASQNKIKASHSKKIGGQRHLSDELEDQIVRAINTLADWKVPLEGLDIRSMVKNYLDACGVKDSVFVENLPGTD